MKNIRPKFNRKWHIARRGVLYSLVLCVLILGLGGVGFWLIDPRIDSLGDGLWLAFTTAATVGYGDTYPVTDAGRFVGVILMIAGVSAFSVLTSYIASTFMSRGRNT